MRRERLFDSNLIGVFFKDFPKALSCHWAAESCDEKVFFHIIGEAFCVRLNDIAGLVDILNDPLMSKFPHWDEAIFSTFSVSEDAAVVEVKITKADINEFGNAQSSCVQKFDHCAIAETFRCRNVRSIEQVIDFSFSEIDGVSLSEFWHFDMF